MKKTVNGFAHEEFTTPLLLPQVADDPKKVPHELFASEFSKDQDETKNEDKAKKFFAQIELEARVLSSLLKGKDDVSFTNLSPTHPLRHLQQSTNMGVAAQIATSLGLFDKPKGEDKLNTLLCGYKLE